MNTKNAPNIVAVAALLGAGILATRTGRAAVNHGMCPNNNGHPIYSIQCNTNPQPATCYLPGGTSFGSAWYGYPSNPTYGVFATLGSNVTDYSCVQVFALANWGLCAAFSNSAGFTGYDDTGDCAKYQSTFGSAF